MKEEKWYLADNMEEIQEVPITHVCSMGGWFEATEEEIADDSGHILGRDTGARRKDRVEYCANNLLINASW